MANLTGGFDPTGSITFRLYAPGVNPTVGPAAFTETVGVNGDGTYRTTTGFVSNATGTWHWVAAYNGDPNNKPVSSGPLDEPVTIPPQADLQVVKTVSNPTPVLGDLVTFTVALTNLGPDAATNVVVQDLLPAGLAFVSAAPSQGIYIPAGGLWVVGTVPAGATATLGITAAVVGAGAETNTAAVEHSDQFDPDPSNNASSASVAPLLEIGKGSLLGSLVGPDGTLLDPASNGAFVERLYLTVLGRPADLAGFTALNAAMQSGLSPAAAAAILWDSPEHRGLEADALFERILHHPTDAAARAASIQFLLLGGGEDGLARLLLTSAEYTAAHPDAAGFINGLYQDVLGRPADPAGQAAALGLLQSGVSRGALAAAVLRTPEALAREADRLFLEVLGRPAGTAGEQAAVVALSLGLSEDALAQVLLTSAEFLALAG
jgi:uncharacterized repeat protein (TIGR01451 family)